MSSSTLSALPSTGDDGAMSAPSPRADGPRRRTFTPQQKLAHLEAYEEASQQQVGGAYLRREGLYSSLISELAPAARCRRAGGQAGRPEGRPAE